jgi:Domain of unknown function (DUF1905)
MGTSAVARHIGGTRFTTALFPGDGRYLVPVKAAVQRAEAIGEGAIVEVVVRLNAAHRNDGARRQRRMSARGQGQTRARDAGGRPALYRVR